MIGKGVDAPDAEVMIAAAAAVYVTYLGSLLADDEMMGGDVENNDEIKVAGRESENQS